MKLQSLLLLFGCVGYIINGSESKTSNQIAALIKDYLQYNYFKTLLLVSCANQPNINPTEIIFAIHHERVWINVLDISVGELEIASFDYDQFFIRLSGVHCVVMDLECDQAGAFLREISKRILFHYERNWLLFSSSFNESYYSLSQQNINVDAEISLVIPVDTETENDQFGYDLYEVYNPRHKYGLNVTHMGHWSKSIGLIVQLNEQTKTERRRNFRGLTFTSVVTVSEKSHKVYFNKIELLCTVEITPGLL